MAGLREGIKTHKSRFGRYLWLACAIGIVMPAGRASATPPPSPGATETTSNPQEQSANPGGSAPTGPFSNLSRSGYLLGDMFGLRPALAKVGINFTLTETSEILGNISGGTKKGFDYDGLTTATLTLDTQRAFDWRGGTFDISALQIHGRNLSADNLQTLQTASGIEADRATRLWELWYQQKFFDDNRVDVKVGQQSLDQEFMVSQNAGYFVNTMFGWPMVPSADLPGGGPAYPLSAPGVRVRVRPTDSITVLGGVFNGAPANRSGGDSQAENPSGTNFPLNGGVLLIGEIQYAYPALGSMVYEGQSEPLARVYKLGFWYDSEDFDDYRIDSSGHPLASPGSNGIPRSHHGDYSIYAVADQMLWRSSDDIDRTLNGFVRIMGTPQDDRNLIDFSLNAGITLHDPLPHRDDDTFGLALGYAKVSGSVSGLDRDTNHFTGSSFPVRGSETFLEATYQCQLTPWCQVQPDLQYVFNPGGGIPDPETGKKIKDELVVGVRVNISF
jgi:porin